MRQWQGKTLYDKQDLIKMGILKPDRSTPGTRAGATPGSVFNSLSPDQQLRVVRELVRDLTGRPDAAPRHDATWNSAAAQESGSGSAFWNL